MAALNSLLAPHSSFPSKTPRSFPSPLSASFHCSVLRLSSSIKNARLHCHASASSSAAAVVTEAEPDAAGEGEKFDWFAHWYPVAPICDLDKRRPQAKTVMGLDLVVWWDRTKGRWQVFDDHCPHRLAPLSEGRIDPWGRLQCVYHGWCFDGSGSCKYIPQAPDDGPPVSNFACPTILLCSAVEISLYEVLIENLMDPAHVPYAHHGIMRIPKSLTSRYRDSFTVNADREGGSPIDIRIETSNINGFLAQRDIGYNKFIAPCVFYSAPHRLMSGNGSASSSDVQGTRPAMLICGRLVTTSVVLPKFKACLFGFTLIYFSSQERKFAKAGYSNWPKVCFVPTKSDAIVVAFRNWLRKYSNNQINWGTTSSEQLPPTPPREQLMDR
ncbi:hypothetical protein B296_00030493 [Ensete ventricosum]|uniref:Rieske domain-containing protein n=1 Tax=Ensete ventricosum TaxID=4639 RepID=A0A426YJ87_ENSVE|nr:hypothetical protein B296_00030493 [Ensete ventricosum]